MIKKDTIEYTILSLIGQTGEMQTEDLYRLQYGKEYIRKTISRLISGGYIKAYRYSGIRCLRLTARCRHYLKENFPERFSDKFSGFSSTNKIRNDINRRTRYHRLGTAMVLLYLAGVKIFADEKSMMKKNIGFTRAVGADRADYSSDKNTAEFYTSSELKTAGMFMNARTSRALGVIYSHPDVYILYHVGDGFFKWENKTEETFFYRANQVFLNDICKSPKMIFIGNDMEAMKNILSHKKNGIKRVFDAKNRYDNIFFLDSSNSAQNQLKYYIDGRKQSEVNQSINYNFSLEDKGYRFFSRAEDRKFIANFTTLNLSAIRFLKDVTLSSKDEAHIVCYDFQMPYLREYFGDNNGVEYCTVRET